MQLINRYIKYTAFGVLALMIIVLAITTVVGRVYGTAFVLDTIYHAGWFISLWALLAFMMFIYLIINNIYKRIACFVLHLSFLAILLGGLVTYFWGERGVMHIRQGEVGNFFLSDDGTHLVYMPFQIRLLHFNVECHPGTDVPSGYCGTIKAGGQQSRVAVNEILEEGGYRIGLKGYDPDQKGVTLTISHDRYGIGITYAGYLILCLSLLWLLYLRIGVRKVVMVFAVVALAWLCVSLFKPITPVLRSPWLAAHVSVIIIAYSLFLFMAVTAILSLSSPKRSDYYYQLNYELLLAGLVLLATGICIGAVWANNSWGRYWGWDAKETWALICLLTYALPIHRQQLSFLSKPRNFHLYCAFAFVVVVITFLGVTFLLGGIHSYL